MFVYILVCVQPCCSVYNNNNASILYRCCPLRTRQWIWHILRHKGLLLMVLVSSLRGRTRKRRQTTHLLDGLIGDGDGSYEELQRLRDWLRTEEERVNTEFTGRLLLLLLLVVVLLVHQRILYKVAATAFDCIRGTGPAYFKHVSTPASDISGRAHLRSAERRDILVPRTRTELGRRSFPVAAPTVWNSLPAHLRSTLIGLRQFRDGLKSHLFADAYF